MPSSKPTLLESDPQTTEKSLLRRIFALKVTLVAIIMLGVAVFLYVAQVLGEKFPQTFWQFFVHGVFASLAEALFVAASVGITYDWIVREETNKYLKLTIRNELEKLKEKLIADFPEVLLNGKVQEQVLQKGRIQGILTQLLVSLAGEKRMAEALTNIVLENGLRFDERWTNYRYQLILKNIATCPESPFPERMADEYFELVVRIRYETILRRKTLYFVLARTLEEFNQMLGQRRYEARWLSPGGYLAETRPDYFMKVQSVKVDDIELNVKDSGKRLPYLVSCEHKDLEKKLGTNVTVTYMFTTIVRRSDRAVFTTVVCPTYDIYIEFDYSGADIRRDSADVLDYFVSATRANIQNVSDQRILVEVKDWVFPKGGAIFFWDTRDLKDSDP